MRGIRPISAALLLALLGAAAVLPIAAASTVRKGCHCVVRMACCEDGICRMGGDEPPAYGAEWRTCRREVPAAATSPLDSYETALKSFFEWKRASAVVSLDDVPAARAHACAPRPATPPPRLSSF